MLRQGAGDLINNNQVLVVQALSPVDLVQERINLLEEAFRLLQEGKNKEKSYDFNNELEPISPHISNTLFPHGFKICHVTPYDGTTDPSSHMSTFNTVMRASIVTSQIP